MSKFQDQNEREKEYIRICELSYQMALSLKLFTVLMLVQTDKNKFAKHYLVLEKLLNRI